MSASVFPSVSRKNTIHRSWCSHLGDQVRLVDELDPSLLQRLVARVDVRSPCSTAPTPDGRTPPTRRVLEHEPHAATVEEREVRHLEQKPHAQRVAVEPHGARRCPSRDRDLPDAVERYLFRLVVIVGSSLVKVPVAVPPPAVLSLAMLTIMHNAEPNARAANASRASDPASTRSAGPRSLARPKDESERIADRLHSAAIHLLRRLRREDAKTGLSAPRLSALSVVVFGGPLTLGELADRGTGAPADDDAARVGARGRRARHARARRRTTAASRAFARRRKGARCSCAAARGVSPR